MLVDWQEDSLEAAGQLPSSQLALSRYLPGVHQAAWEAVGRRQE